MRQLLHSTRGFIPFLERNTRVRRCGSLRPVCTWSGPVAPGACTLDKRNASQVSATPSPHLLASPRRSGGRVYDSHLMSPTTSDRRHAESFESKRDLFVQFLIHFGIFYLCSGCSVHLCPIIDTSPLLSAIVAEAASQ